MTEWRSIFGDAAIACFILPR
ncbi:hypothetical protein [Martelella sp. FOR1707]